MSSTTPRSSAVARRCLPAESRTFVSLTPACIQRCVVDRYLRGSFAVNRLLVLCDSTLAQVSLDTAIRELRNDESLPAAPACTPRLRARTNLRLSLNTLQMMQMR